MSEETNPCPVCDSGLKISKKNKTGELNLECNTCGIFLIDESLLKDKESIEKIKKFKRRISGMLRFLNIQNKIPHLKLTNFDEYIENPIIPSPQEFDTKLNFLLSAMKINAGSPGHVCTINLENDYPLAFAKSEHELERLLESLEDDRLIELEPDITPGFREDVEEIRTFKKRRKGMSSLSFGRRREIVFSFYITRKGWNTNNFEKIGTTGFIAIDFNDSMNSTIEAIKMGISESGYTPMVIKNEEYPEMVMEKALSEIKKSAFVIADITNLRPSVFYEAGFARAIGKPVFYVCSEEFHKELKKNSKDLEFYSKHYKIRFYKDISQLKEMVVILIEANFSIRKKT